MMKSPPVARKAIGKYGDYDGSTILPALCTASSIAFSLSECTCKSLVAGGMMGVSEVVFWIGGLLVGKELIKKYRQKLNPLRWLCCNRNNQKTWTCAGLCLMTIWNFFSDFPGLQKKEQQGRILFRINNQEVWKKEISVQTFKNNTCRQGSTRSWRHLFWPFKARWNSGSAI